MPPHWLDVFVACCGEHEEKTHVEWHKKQLEQAERQLDLEEEEEAEVKKAKNLDKEVKKLEIKKAKKLERKKKKKEKKNQDSENMFFKLLIKAFAAHSAARDIPNYPNWD